MDETHPIAQLLADIDAQYAEMNRVLRELLTVLRELKAIMEHEKGKAKPE